MKTASHLTLLVLVARSSCSFFLCPTSLPSHFLLLLLTPEQSITSPYFLSFHSLLFLHLNKQINRNLLLVVNQSGKMPGKATKGNEQSGEWAKGVAFGIINGIMVRTNCFLVDIEVQILMLLFFDCILNR